MAAAAATEAHTITEQKSLELTRNLLRIAIFNISYIRGLFPEEYFLDTSVPSLDMKVKKLLPRDLESRRLIDWMEKGVYDALKMKYLRTMSLTLCAGENGPLIEEYSFSFDYSMTSEEVSIHMSKNGRIKKSLRIGSGTEFNQEQTRKSACKMMRTLVTLMHTLDGVPEERTILVKLFYYDDLTPADYEPPFFRSCTFDVKKQWLKSPFCMKAGEVSSEFITFSLKVRSTLDPCEDEIDQDSVCSPANSSASEASTDSASLEDGNQDSQTASKENQENTAQASALLTLADATNNLMEDDDITEDIKQEISNLEIVKDWLLSRPPLSFDVADLLENFPDISEKHTEELISRLVKDNFLVKLGNEKYAMSKRNRQVESYCESEKSVPAETAAKVLLKVSAQEDALYLKALYNALLRDHITITQLQSSLGKEVNCLAARRLIKRMVDEGYVAENATNRKFGRRVLHSEKASRKLEELKSLFDPAEPLLDQINQKANELEHLKLNTSPNSAHLPEFKDIQTEDMDVSTCGALQSFGSELTRHGTASPTAIAYKNDQIVSSAGPELRKRANSRESHLKINNTSGKFSPSRQRQMSKRGFQFCGSQETLDNGLPRKASMV